MNLCMSVTVSLTVPVFEQLNLSLCGYEFLCAAV